jgi:hypothetical protein
MQTEDFVTGVGVIYETGFGLDDWIYWHLIHSHNSGLQATQRCRWSTFFAVHRYTKTRVLSLHQSYPGNGFITVSLSGQTTHEVCFSEPNSFLAISSQPPSSAISTSRPNSRQKLIQTTSARTTQKTQPIYNWEGFFTDPLPSNGRSIVARVSFREKVFTDSLPSNGSIVTLFIKTF